MYEDEPQDRVHDFLADAVFGDHPLGRRVLGDAEVIASIPIPDIETYHQARYTGANVVVGAAGHLDHERIRAAERLVSPGAAATASPGEKRRRRRGCASMRRTPSSTTSASGAGIARDDERRYALAVLDSIFGGSTSSRLFREVREKRGSPTRSAPTTSSTRTRPRRDLRRHPRGQRRGGLRDHRHRARAPANRAGLDRGAGPRQGERQGPPRALLRVDAARMTRISAQPSLTCRSTASTRCSPRSTPSRSTT